MQDQGQCTAQETTEIEGFVNDLRKPDDRIKDLTGRLMVVADRLFGPCSDVDKANGANPPSCGHIPGLRNGIEDITHALNDLATQVQRLEVL